MTTTPKAIRDTETEKLDQELEEILKLAEGDVDQETRRFIEEVLKFVPEESAPEYHIFTSHEGAINASEKRDSD